MSPEEKSLRSALQKLGRRSTPDHQLSEDVVELTQKLDALVAVALLPTGERFRHEKRGTVYDVMAFGHANSANERYVAHEDVMDTSDGVASWAIGPEKVIFDRDEVIIYRDVQSGHIGIRAIPEFADGRFTRHPAPPGGTPVDPASALVTHLTAMGATVPPALTAEAVVSLTPAIAKVADQGDTPSRHGYYDGPSPTFKGKTALLQHVGDGTLLAQFDDMEFTHLGVNYGHGWHSFNMMVWSVIPDDGIYKGCRVTYKSDGNGGPSPRDGTTGTVFARKLDEVRVAWDDQFVAVWGNQVSLVWADEVKPVK